MANARDGFSASAWFEVVPASHLPTPSTRSHSVTFPLDPDEAAYEVSAAGLGYPDRVTFAWTGPSEVTPFRVDLFLHADRSSKAPLVLVRDLDLRKFLHQPATLDPTLEDLDRLQAYFEEFARKAKLIYPVTQASRAYEEEALGRARGLLSKASGMVSASALNQPSRALSTAMDALQPSALQTASEQLMAALRMIDRDESLPTNQKAQLIDTLNAASQDLLHVSAARGISTLKITNNCREPGNFEVALADAVGHTVLKGSFNVTPDVYDDLLREYHGLGIQDQGTGQRVSSSLRRRSPGRYWHSLLPWTWLRTFPEVRIDAVREISLDGSRDIRTAHRDRGTIEIVRGRIPYEVSSLETRKKAAFRHSQGEPLAYVRVNPELPIPGGFRLPHDQSPNAYWLTPANAGKIVPHRFASFEDLQTYVVYLSGFESNGVYVGRAKRRSLAWNARVRRDAARHTLPEEEPEHIEWDRANGRWQFDYGYLQDLHAFELERTEDDLVTIRLLARAGSHRAVNFVFGRIRVAPGKTVRHLFGIGTQPLIADYNANVFQEVPAYALAFGDDGIILDHHRPDVGVEQVQIRRTSEDGFVVTLISHERIMPVWSGVLRGSVAQARAG